MFGPDSNVKKLVSDSELFVFKKLITAIYSKIQLEANSQNSFQTANEKTNYTRRKLRFNFLGKLIIQPMDTIHVYISSKSRYDNKLTTGMNSMFAGAGFLGNVNKTLTDLKNATSSLFNPSGSIPFLVEKSAFVGSSFPNYLWSLMR